jgi:hypothetical protein
LIVLLGWGIGSSQDLYTQDKHNREKCGHTPTPRVEFEHTVPLFERSKVKRVVGSFLFIYLKTLFNYGRHVAIILKITFNDKISETVKSQCMKQVVAVETVPLLSITGSFSDDKINIFLHFHLFLLDISL